MNIRKLPSGSYQIRQKHKGKEYTITLKHKPSEKEAIRLMAEKLEHTEEINIRESFEEASNEYITAKSKILSPSTIVGYEKILRGISKGFKKKRINDITQMDVQKEINLFAGEHSPKSVRNTHSFISSVLKAYRPNMIINTTLPQKVPKELYIPSDEDVRRILERAKGTDYEIALSLACFGLRKSEICAIDSSDLDGCTLSITKSKIKDQSGKYIIRPMTKTVGSYRKIQIPQYLADMIQEKGVVYEGHPQNIYRALVAYEEELNIPHFPLHKLRHYFASKMSTMTDDATVMAMGGWTSDRTLKQIYRHSMADKDQKQALAEELGQVLLK